MPPVIDSELRFTSDTPIAITGGCMFTRPPLVSLALLTALISAPQAQTGAPEILWQFEAGG
jgi:hypothetical protein